MQRPSLLDLLTRVGASKASRERIGHISGARFVPATGPGGDRVRECDARRLLSGWQPTRGATRKHSADTGAPALVRTDGGRGTPPKTLPRRQQRRRERFAEHTQSAAATCRLQNRSLFAYLRELITAHNRGEPFPAPT